MPRREVLLVNGEVYHIFTKSIAGFHIFNTDYEFSRVIATMCYYQMTKPEIKFSQFVQMHGIPKADNSWFSEKEKLVQIVAYCFMPTHIHFILKQLQNEGITTFARNTLNSYSRFFNLKHSRKGPLWEGRFKNVLVESNEQLLHLTRYVHLNPVTSYLVEKPEEWPASSYREYVTVGESKDKICGYYDLLDIEPTSYAAFVLDSVSYQRELSKIRKLLYD